jgi:hypothetical protein
MPRPTNTTPRRRGEEVIRLRDRSDAHSAALLQSSAGVKCLALAIAHPHEMQDASDEILRISRATIAPVRGGDCQPPGEGKIRRKACLVLAIDGDISTRGDRMRIRRKKSRLAVRSIKTRRGSVVGFQRCLMCTRIGKSQRRLRSIGAGGSEDGAELHGTTPMGIGDSKVLGVSGAARARS